MAALEASAAESVASVVRHHLFSKAMHFFMPSIMGLKGSFHFCETRVERKMSFSRFPLLVFEIMGLRQLSFLTPKPQIRRAQADLCRNNIVV